MRQSQTRAHLEKPSRKGREAKRQTAECGRSRETEREIVLGRQGKRDEEPAMRERARVTGG